MQRGAGSSAEHPRRHSGQGCLERASSYFVSLLVGDVPSPAWPGSSISQWRTTSLSSPQDITLTVLTSTCALAKSELRAHHLSPASGAGCGQLSVVHRSQGEDWASQRPLTGPQCPEGGLGKGLSPQTLVLPEWYDVCVHAKLLHLCPTPFDPMDCSLPGTSVHAILQARMLEWVVIPSSRGSSRPRDWTHVSYVSCIGRWVLYHKRHLGSPFKRILPVKTTHSEF